MKNVGFLGLLLTATVLLVLAFPAGAAGPNVPLAPKIATPAVPAVAVAVPERHPHIDEALESMRAARKHLETAAHDFGGHRVKAIEHLDQAIREAEVCLTMR